MKATLLGISFLVLSFVLFSCEKVDVVMNEQPTITAPKYFIKAKYNGVQKEFASSAVASKHNFGAVWGLALIGQAGQESCTIALWSSVDDFTQGKTYSHLSSTGNNYNTYGYFENQTGTNAEWISEYSYGTVAPKFQCTLTSITDTTIRGNFSADIYKAVSGPQQKIIITEGEFYVKKQ